MKKKYIASIVVILILAAVVFFAIQNQKRTMEQTDAYQFAEEYMSINGTENNNGKEYRKIEIPKDNPFVYAKAEDIVSKIEKKESFIVYFGFSTCPWCRSVLEELIHAAKDKKVDTIYYVDVLEIRDIKEIDENGNITTTREGTAGYMELIQKLDNVLDDYTLSKGEETISVGEKRIYAPNVVAISRGKALQLETGIPEDLKDPYGELTKDMKKYSYEKFTCLMKCLEEDSITCQKNSC